MPSSEGFCVPTGNFTNCFVIDGAMTVQSSGAIDDAIQRFYAIVEFVMNQDGLVLLPFDGKTFYYKSTDQLNIDQEQTTMRPRDGGEPEDIQAAIDDNQEELVANDDNGNKKMKAIMIHVFISVGAFICTAVIMYSFLLHCHPRVSKKSTSDAMEKPKYGVQDQKEEEDQNHRTLGIRANDLLAQSWVALKFSSSLCSCSEESIEAQDQYLPGIFTPSISSDCCSSMSDLSIE